VRSYLWIILAFVISAVLWTVYAHTKIPPNIEVKGPTDWLPWISLAASIVSLLTGVVGLLLKIQEFRTRKAR
jgi:hypothetical protein